LISQVNEHQVQPEPPALLVPQAGYTGAAA
jgi:hypothetical protein